MKIAFILACTLLGFAATSANASLVLLATDDSVAIGNPFPGNSGQGSMESWLLRVVDDYNAANGTALPTPGGQILRVETGDNAPRGLTNFGNNTRQITIEAGDFDYIVFHWGGNQRRGANYEAYYLDTSDGSSSFTFDSPNRGLSWYGIFSGTHTAIPEPSTYAMAGLLVVGTAGVGFFRRRKVKGEEEPQDS